MAAASEAVGGPVGSRWGPRRGQRGFRWTPLGVLLALAALCFGLGMVSKTSCANDQWRTDRASINGSPDLTRYTHACDSDIAHAYTDLGLVELAWPWSDERQTRERYGVTDQPALVGLWTYAAARVTHVLAGSPDLSERYQQSSTTLAEDPDVRRERVIFTALNAVGLAFLALLAVAALSKVHRRRPWDAAGFAAAPVLVLAGVVSWDLMAAAAVAGALLAWARGRLVLAGVLVGVGAAAGVWPVLVLAAFLLGAIRERRAVDVLPTAVTALGVWALLNAPAYLSGRSQWERAWSAFVERTPDQGSFWAILDDSITLSQDTALTVSLILTVAWIAGVVALALRAPTRPRVSQLAFLLVAGVLVLSLSYEPHQALWLLPLAALARPRWRDLLVWQAGEVFHFVMLAWWLGGVLSTSGDGGSGFYWIAIAVRLGATLWLVAVVVRDVWWAEFDPVFDERQPSEATK